jgi:hypothetical protein
MDNLNRLRRKILNLEVFAECPIKLSLHAAVAMGYVITAGAYSACFTVGLAGLVKEVASLQHRSLWLVNNQ